MVAARACSRATIIKGNITHNGEMSTNVFLCRHAKLKEHVLKFSFSFVELAYEAKSFVQYVTVPTAECKKEQLA
jgi:hypothetical protein